MSYALEPKLTYASKLIPIWFLLAAQGGFVNAFGFVACGRYVSHVTGIGTMFGVSFGQQELWVALEMLAVIGVFIAGSFVAASVTAVLAQRGHRPQLRGVNLLISLLLASVALAGHAGWFGPMGDEFARPRDIFLLLTLSFVCGMQNGTFSLLTQGQIRTTHLTGLSTDIGSDLAHLLFAPKKDAPVSVRRVGTTRILLFSGFALGAVLAAWLGGNFGYIALFGPAVVAAGIGIYLEQKLSSLRTAPAPAHERVRTPEVVKTEKVESNRPWDEGPRA